MINVHPKTCNLCGGPVEFASNAIIYGRQYGSGYCYHCTRCGAYVGTHRPWPDRAMGILADEEMRAWKMICHELFDALWKPTGNHRLRRQLYSRLAVQMGIEVDDCHFGYFDLEALKKAYQIVSAWSIDDSGN